MMDMDGILDFPCSDQGRGRKRVEVKITRTIRYECVSKSRHNWRDDACRRLARLVHPRGL